MRLNKDKINEIFDSFPSYIDYILLSVVILFIGLYLEAWCGYPKGDDAYLHLTKIKFIVDNFPYIHWSPYQYFGFEPFKTYPFISYLILAAIHKITGMQLENLLTGALLFSLVLFGISILKLSRYLKISRWGGLIFSLLIFSTPAFWNFSTLGGAYLRVYALPFMILSIFYVIKHIDEINSKKTNMLTYLKVVTVLSITALLHPFIWIFTFTTVLLLYIIGIPGIINKFKISIQIFIPVSLISFWIYIPYLQMKLKSPLLSLHNYSLNPLYGLLRTLPTTNLTLNTTYAFLTLILTLPLFVLLFKYIKNSSIKYKRSTISLLITSLLLSFYHLLFGWFSMPRFIYIISAYDSAFWLALFLLLFIISAYSLFEINFAGKLIKFDSIKIGLVLLVVLQFSFTLPLVNNNFTSHTAPNDNRTITFESNQFLEKYVDSIPEGYRIGITHRVFTRWINYVHPSLKMTGGRDEVSQPNKEYQDWFNDRVFYRYDHDKIEQMYLDDIPKILPEYGFLDNKSINPSLWFLDWTGSRGMVIYPNIMMNWNTIQEYLMRPQIFEIESGKTSFGDIFYIKYNQSSPIIMASDAHILAIPTDQNIDSLFTKTLMVLSYINANSKVIIPINVDFYKISLYELNQFDTIIVTNEQYLKYYDKLIMYVKNGGTLLLVRDGKTQNIELNSSHIKYNSEEIENGKIICLNFSMDDLVKAQDFKIIFDFVCLLNPSIHAEKVEYFTDWNIGHTTEKTSAEIISQNKNTSANLYYVVNTSLEHNQINLYSNATRLFPTDQQGVITFEMYSNNWRNMYTDIVIKNSNYQNGYLFYPLKLKSENITYPNEGWRKFSIAITGFKIKGDYSYLLKNFNIIEIAINQDAPYDSENNTIRLRNVELSIYNMTIENNKVESPFVQETDEITHAELSYIRENPQEIIINLQNKSKGILVKESFDKNWRAYLINDYKTEELPIYFAGPAFMYIKIPEDFTAPLNVTLKYETKLFG